MTRFFKLHEDIQELIKGLLPDNTQESVKTSITDLFIEYLQNEIKRAEEPNKKVFLSAEDALAISKGEYPEWYKAFVVDQQLTMLYDEIETTCYSNAHTSCLLVPGRKCPQDVKDAVNKILTESGYTIDEKENGNTVISWENPIAIGEE